MTFLGLTIAEISAIIAIIGALALWFKSVRRLIQRIWNNTIGSRTQQLNRIEAELISNSGSSMRDAVKRIENRVNEIDAFQRAQLNLHDVAVVRTDSKGKVIAVNREYQRLTGASLSEVAGDGWINVIHASNRDEIVRKWFNAVRDRREFHEDILFININTDETFMAHANVYKEIDNNDNIVGYLGVIIPIMDENCPYIRTCKAHAKLGLNDGD